jgi:hypothetical protein
VFPVGASRRMHRIASIILSDICSEPLGLHDEFPRCDAVRRSLGWASHRWRRRFEPAGSRRCHHSSVEVETSQVLVRNVAHASSLGRNQAAGTCLP